MDLRKGVLNTIAKMAEMAQDMVGHTLELKVEADGRAYHVRKGLSGKLLDALYEDRMTDLLAKFSQTTQGGALLSFLEEKGTAITFDHRFSRGVTGVACSDNSIRLKAGLPMVELILTLAHEARHQVQYQEMPGSNRILPPRPSLAKMLLTEADAHAFEQKFAEDYAKVTGDRSLLDNKLADWKGRAPQEGLSDAETFIQWIDILKEHRGYLSASFSSMGATQRYIENYIEGDEIATLSPVGDTQKIITDMAGKICTKLGLKPEKIVQRLTFGDNAERALAVADARYQQVYERLQVGGAALAASAPAVQQADRSARAFQ